MKRISILITIVLLLSIFTAVPISAPPPPTEVWVDDDGPDNGYDYFDTIQEGIYAVEVGGTVHVASGTYTYTGMTSIIDIDKNIALLGAGKDSTIVDAQDSYRCIYTLNLDSSTIIDGFTFENGNRSSGAAMYNNNSSPTITNCIFSGNFSGMGAGMYNNYSSPTITNCIFSGNYSSMGAGIYNNNSSPIINNCTFTNNTADDDGGGIFNYDCYPTISKCTFSNNSANNGGGIFNEESCYPVVTNCTFSNNTADNDGGGFYTRDGSATVTGCIFKENTAVRWQGGGMYNRNSTLFVTDCIFAYNTAESRNSGAMHNEEVTLVLTNSVFYGNYANDNGGVMKNVDGSDITMTNCTFAYNSARNNTGGLYNDNNTSPLITNCIFWGNEVEIHNEDNDSNPIVKYSNVEGGYPGEGNIDANPLFLYNYSLSYCSPCIDSGTDTSDSSYGSVIDDIVGTPRPQKNAYDMGAYEFVGGGWSPIVMKPLVMVTLSKANTIWECLLQQLPEEVPENVLELLDDFQVHMANVAMLSNPIYANGELNKAMSLMGQINDTLDCGCYTD